jgi:thiol-disulfide isomerase/thioredoxin
MKRHISLIIAVALAAGTALTFAAGSSEWVGKQLPSLGVSFLKAKPDLKGKPAIVEFWATWCPPCRASIPHLNEIHQKYKDKGLVVIGITDEARGTVENFKRKTPMDYNVAVGGAAISKKLGINGIPHAFLVGKDGKIVWEGHPTSLKEADIENVLK